MRPRLVFHRLDDFQRPPILFARRFPRARQVGVHIADVTAFLPHDGPLDKEARLRATTVYLVHRRIDMLPALLSSDLCSLHAKTDRLSVSVVWEAEEDGEDIRICSRGCGGAGFPWEARAFAWGGCGGRPGLRSSATGEGYGYRRNDVFSFLSSFPLCCCCCWSEMLHAIAFARGSAGSS